MTTLYHNICLWWATRRYDQQRSRLFAPCKGCGHPTNLIWCEVC